MQFQDISKVYDSKSEDYESSGESEAGESESFGDERFGNCFICFQDGLFLSYLTMIRYNIVNNDKESK